MTSNSWRLTNLNSVGLSEFFVWRFLKGRKDIICSKGSYTLRTKGSGKKETSQENIKLNKCSQDICSMCNIFLKTIFRQYFFLPI